MKNFTAPEFIIVRAGTINNTGFKIVKLCKVYKLNYTNLFLAHKAFKYNMNVKGNGPEKLT